MLQFGLAMIAGRVVSLAFVGLAAVAAPAATLRPTVTSSTEADVMTETLSEVARRLSLERWRAAMEMRSSDALRSLALPRPEVMQDELPIEMKDDYDTAVQAAADSSLPIDDIAQFEGLGHGFTQGKFESANGIPPDASGAIGTDQFVQIVNSSLAVFDRNGKLLMFLPTEDVWSKFKGKCGQKNGGVDGVVLFDRLAGRWLITASIVDINGDHFQCVAVSRTADATGRYARYEFAFGQLLNDYAKFAVWPDAYYATYDMFEDRSKPPLNTRVCAYDRRAMLRAELKATQQCVDPRDRHLLPADGGVNVAPPALVVGIGDERVNLWTYTVDWADTSNSRFDGPRAVTVARYQYGCDDCIMQKGASHFLWPLGDRPMFRALLSGGAGAETLLLNSTVTVYKGAARVTGIRWYEIEDPRSAPIVSQQSTYSPDDSSRLMASMAKDKMGNIAIGYTVSGTAIHPSIFIAGRAEIDRQSTLSKERPVKESPYSQDVQEWGHYTQMTIDPADDCTFWYVSEYLGSDKNWWSTCIAHFKFQNCR